MFLTETHVWVDLFTKSKLPDYKTFKFTCFQYLGFYGKRASLTLINNDKYTYNL